MIKCVNCWIWTCFQKWKLHNSFMSQIISHIFHVILGRFFKQIGALTWCLNDQQNIDLSYKDIISEMIFTVLTTTMMLVMFASADAVRQPCPRTRVSVSTDLWLTSKHFSPTPVTTIDVIFQTSTPWALLNQFHWR